MTLVYKVKTDKTFDSALESLKENIGAIGFGILWQLNFKDKFKEKDLEFADNFIILEVCNPFKAHQVLLENREMGFFLPCKIAVYEENGSTYIGMPRPTELMNSSENEKLIEIAEEVERLLKSAIDQASISS